MRTPVTAYGLVILITWLARRMGRGTRLVLIGHVSGGSGVAGLDPFVRITLHLLVGFVPFWRCVYVTVHLGLSLLTRCGLLLRCCLHRNRAAGQHGNCKNWDSHKAFLQWAAPVPNALRPRRFPAPEKLECQDSSPYHGGLGRLWPVKFFDMWEGRNREDLNMPPGMADRIRQSE